MVLPTTNCFIFFDAKYSFLGPLACVTNLNLYKGTKITDVIFLANADQLKGEAWRTFAGDAFVTLVFCSILFSGHTHKTNQIPRPPERKGAMPSAKYAAW